MNIDKNRNIAITSMENLKFISKPLQNKYIEFVQKKYINKRVEDLTVSIITTAQSNAGKDKSTHPWVVNLVELFRSMGFSNNNITLIDLETEPEKIEILKTSDIIHVKGGDYYYLQMYLDKYNIKEILDKKSIEGIISGTCGGAIALLSNICDFVIDIYEEKNITNIPTNKFKGLNIFSLENVFPLVHEEWVDKNKIKKYFSKNKDINFNILPLKNTEMIIFQDGKCNKFYDTGESCPLEIKSSQEYIKQLI